MHKSKRVRIYIYRQVSLGIGEKENLPHEILGNEEKERRKEMSKFYVCSHCGNIVELVKNVGVPLFCCGEKMSPLVPNTTDAAGEKHVPAVEVKGKEVVVKVGEVTHPMTEEHLIQWIYLETDKGSQIRYLTAQDAPEATFVIGDEKPVAVYEYCNLHGLWKADL